uniref:Kunitz proteinase inhibitor 9 n=1 Tax=Trifolium repens TaxID=3899 RepID=U5NDQ5_TRIRP|nr:Kunitz proteinase inhibitor 9 [Trifolium repens]
MKPTMLTTLSLLLFALTTYFPLAFSNEQLADINGNPIFYSTHFYIMPSIFGAAGGGLKLGETGKSTCPLTVLQDYSEVNNGLELKFHNPGDIIIDLITTDKPLAGIEFVEKPECAESSKWVVVEDDDFPRPYVGIGGIEDNKGKRIMNGSFKIVKHDFGYKIVFCPRFTAPPGLCFDIGRHDDANGRRLVLTEDDPFEIVFVIPRRSVA